MPGERVPGDEYRALDHPARRRIIELLGTHPTLGFSELRGETGLPVGTLYYHLDVLRGLVAQDASRRYLLTKEGRKLFESFAEREGIPVERKSRALRILPGWIFSRLEGSTSRSAAAWVAVAFLGAVLSNLGGQALVLMHFGVSVFPDWLDMTLFPASMLAYLAFCLGTSYLVSGRATDLAGLLASGVAYVPYLLLPALAAVFGSVVSGGAGLLFLLLAILVQGFSITLGAAYMSSTYGMRLERSLLLQLLFYVIATAVYSVLQYQGLIADAWRTLG